MVASNKILAESETGEEEFWQLRLFRKSLKKQQK